MKNFTVVAWASIGVLALVKHFTGAPVGQYAHLWEAWLCLLLAALAAGRDW